MKFFCVTNPTQRTTNDLLRSACNVRGIEYVDADISSKGSPGDLVYRVVSGKTVGVLKIEEKLIGAGVTSLYKDFSYFNKIHDRGMDYDSSVLSKYSISVPREYIPTNKTTHGEIIEQIKMFGNFPVVVKILGGSHGVGVIRIDGLQSLLSLVDFLSSRNEKFVIKEFISAQRSARIIVLNSTVVDSIEYEAKENDFRSNVGSLPTVKKATFSPDVCDLAVKAVDSLGLDFGGVDILISERGPLVIEVNFPCFFARAELLTGTEISGRMIDYLMKKSRDNL
jgi:RimK family alpha-L-glutamate ligase